MKPAPPFLLPFDLRTPSGFGFGVFFNSDTLKSIGMSLHPGGLYSWRLKVTLISYWHVDLENTAYAHGKLRKGLLAEVQSTMVSKQNPRAVVFLFSLGNLSTRRSWYHGRQPEEFLQHDSHCTCQDVLGRESRTSKREFSGWNQRFRKVSMNTVKIINIWCPI